MEAPDERQQSSNSSNQMDQKRADNPLKISNEDIQKVLQVKCKKHPKRNAEFLHLVLDVENARICRLCLKEKEIPFTNYQDIQEIFEESSERELLSYPVLTDSEPGEILKNFGEKIDSETILMDQFFQDLTSKIEIKIGGRKEARKLKIMQKSDIFQRSKVCWSEIIDIENLQQILLDVNNEERLAQFIRNHVANAERNTKKMKEVIDQLRGIKNEFSEEQPNRISSLVCTLLEQIDFFNGSHPSPLQAIEQSDEYRNLFQRKQRDLEDYQWQANQVQQPMPEQQLLSEEIRILMEQHSQEIINLKQENSHLNEEIYGLKQKNKAIKRDNQGHKQILSDPKQNTFDLTQEKQNNLKEFSDLKQQLKEEKESNARLREQLDREHKSSQAGIQQSIESEEYRIEPQRQINQFEDDKNQINQSQQLFFEEQMRILQERHQQEIISIKQENSVLKQNIISQQQEISGLKRENQVIIEDNSDHQVKSDPQQEISDLKQQIQTIMKEYSDLKQQLIGEKESNTRLREQLDREHKSSKPGIQQSIEDQVKFLLGKNKKGMDIFVEQKSYQKPKFKLGCKQRLSRFYNKKFLNNQLQSIKITNLLPRANLILGNVRDSKKLQVSKNNQQELEFHNNTEDTQYGLSYLDFILDRSTNYIIHVQLQQTKGQGKWFWFGLLPDSEKNATDLSKRRIRYSEYGSGGDLNTYLKGKFMWTNDMSLEKRNLEMRINIQRQILRVGSLPNYESIVRIDDPTQIKPTTHYRFFLYGLNDQSKMTITKLEAVSQFNDMM